MGILSVRKTVLTAVAVATVATGMASSPAMAWRGGYGAPLAAGVIGGLAAGAIIGSATHPYGYGYGYGGSYNYGYAPVYAAPAYGGCYRERRAVYDSWGEFAGYRLVRVCD